MQSTFQISLQPFTYKVVFKLQQKNLKLISKYFKNTILFTRFFFILTLNYMPNMFTTHYIPDNVLVSTKNDYNTHNLHKKLTKYLKPAGMYPTFLFRVLFQV